MQSIQARWPSAWDRGGGGNSALPGTDPDTVQAEQQVRGADTQHWLSRLAEHQAAVAEAHARETALTEEKKALTLEAQRFRQALRNAQSEITGRFANPGSSPTPATPLPP